jgi:hypothetical protein
MKKLMMLVLLLLVSLPAFAQSQFRGAIKFVCGKADDLHVKAFAFSPGVYYTTINVTNLNSINVSGTKRFSIGLPSQKVGRFNDTVAWALKPSETMQIDCGDIWARLGMATGTFIDGFVHILGTPLRFDVTAVYTVGNGDVPISMDVEAITLR